MLEKHTAKKLSSPQRLSDYACGVFDQLPSRKSVKKAIKKGTILVNGTIATTGKWIHNHDKIELIELFQSTPKIYELVLPIIYEDDYLAIIHKPGGISVSGNQFRTVQNALPFNLKKSEQPDALHYPLPVHRLDNPTSGLLIIAKTKTVRIALGKAFEEKKVKKEYHAIVMGRTSETGCFNDPIDNKPATTLYSLVRFEHSLKNEFLSLLRLEPLTGRTHQIRIHASQNNFPILGDKTYGTEGNVLKGKGLFLAATKLQLSHPISGDLLTVSIPIPNKFITRLNNEGKRWKNYHSS